jgi:hypothetical protein
MRSVTDIFAELLAHPDYLGGVIWCKDDVIGAMEILMEDGCDFTMNIDEIWERIDIGGWEDCATSDGFGAIDMELLTMNAYTNPEEDN